MTTQDESAPPDRYTHLSRRAIEFIRESGGSASHDALLAFVFGVNGSAKLWAPLLNQILSAEPALERHPDDRWAVRGSLPVAPCDLLREFVSIDVETTGLRPRTQRVIEAALIRYRDGREVERFETLINPLKRIPSYIAKLTGISDEMVDEAPVFESVADTIQEFLDGVILVGHNVLFDIGFLNAELDRIGRPALVNERVDTMGLAIRLLPGLRRPSLDRVATELGLTPRNIHRAGVDAEITAKAAWLLVQRAVGMGIQSLDQLESAGASVSRKTVDGVGRGRAVLDRSILVDIPKRPGVYLMRDAHERVIYVGKAKNLRDRVGSYYSQPLGYTRKMDGLLESITTIDTHVTGSEF
ncbi:MAG: exonuclease domain-containing protein [Thermomicrobiales bacterium]